MFLPSAKFHVEALCVEKEERKVSLGLLVRSAFRAMGLGTLEGCCVSATDKTLTALAGGTFSWEINLFIMHDSILRNTLQILPSLSGHSPNAHIDWAGLS